MKKNDVDTDKIEKDKEIISKGFLPRNDEYLEVPHSPQKMIEENPRRYIIEECIPACIELWKKNIYTYKVSNHLDDGVCWIEIKSNALSDKNKKIFMKLVDEDIIKFSHHKGVLSFGVKCVGLDGQKKLLKLAKMFKMQDVPIEQAYVLEEQFLMDYCGCYQEYPNPDYEYMVRPWDATIEASDVDKYVEKYERWKNSNESKESLRRFAPEKVIKPVSEYAIEHGMIYEDGKIYLSKFDYMKHQNYLKYINNKKLQRSKNV